MVQNAYKRLLFWDCIQKQYKLLFFIMFFVILFKRGKHSGFWAAAHEGRVYTCGVTSVSFSFKLTAQKVHRIIILTGYKTVLMWIIDAPYAVSCRDGPFWVDQGCSTRVPVPHSQWQLPRPWIGGCCWAPYNSVPWTLSALGCDRDDNNAFDIV